MDTQEIHVRLPLEEYKKMKKKIEERGLSVTSHIRMLVFEDNRNE